MTEEQLKIWFWDKFNSCYSVKHDNVPNSIYMYYDINFIRAKKLATILNKEVEYPTEIKGICLFELNFINEYIYIDYDNIWSIIVKKYSGVYEEICKLIKGWLEEWDKLKVLTSDYYYLTVSYILEEYNKLKILKNLHFKK